jgi:uncharacterized protein (TIGR03083 family)
VDRDEFLAWVTKNGGVIASAVQEAPNEPVPSCPDWRLRDLGFHVGSVLNLWADIVRRGSLEARPIGLGMEPPPDSALERFVRHEVDAVVEVLSETSEETPAWNWWGDSTARWIPRLLAHETSVHSWDATNALGRPTVIDPTLAADGVVEFFEIWIPYAGRPPEDVGGQIGLQAGDIATDWLVESHADRLPTIRAAATLDSADVRAQGNAAQLVLLLWRRLPPDAMTIIGDRALLARFLAYPDLN